MKGAKLYDIEDLQELLGIGRTRAYELVKEAYKTQQPFKVIKLGKTLPYYLKSHLMTGWKAIPDVLILTNASY